MALTIIDDLIGKWQNNQCNYYGLNEYWAK
jgi:hypothetical protein